MLLDVSLFYKSLKVETAYSPVVFTPHKWFWYITKLAYTLLPKLLDPPEGDKLLLDTCLPDS